MNVLLLDVGQSRDADQRVIEAPGSVVRRTRIELGIGRRVRTGQKVDHLGVGDGGAEVGAGRRSKAAALRVFVPGEVRRTIEIVRLAGLTAILIDRVVALRPGARNEDAHRVIEEAGRDQPGQARVPLLRILSVGAFGRESELAALVIERTAGLQVDGRTQRTFVGAGRGGLLHLQRREQFRGKGVVVERTAAVRGGARVIRTGSRQRF